MSARIASSSRPNASTSSSLRCAYSFTSVIAISSSSDLERAVAGCRGDARLDSVAFTVFGPGPEVAHVPGLEWKHAGLADAHPASERHLNAYLFSSFQKRSGA